jgi:hypothetical protein
MEMPSNSDPNPIGWEMEGCCLEEADVSLGEGSKFE